MSTLGTALLIGLFAWGGAVERERDPQDGRWGLPVPSPTPPRALVWQILEAPNDEIAGRLIASLKTQSSKWTWEELEEWIRQGPPLAAGQPTGLLDRHLECDHVAWASSYFYYIPSTYRPSDPLPLLVIMNGGNWDMSINKARNISYGYLQPWMELAEERGWALLSPAAAKGWGAMGYSLAFSAIADLGRRYHLDPDRIYGWGQSMGGHACWRLAMFAPDRWAGLSPVCGGYDSYGPAMVVTNNLALFQVWGETDPHSAGLNKTNRVLAEALKSFGYDHRIVPKPGGHELFEDTFPDILKYFSSRPRNLYPKKVIGNVGTLDLTEADGAGQKEAYAWQKPLPWTRRHYWLEALEKTEAAKGGKLTGEKTGVNAFSLTTENLKRVVLYLHDPLADLSKPITVSVNGGKPRPFTAERSLEVLFHNVRTYQDRGRIYTAALTLTANE